MACIEWLAEWQLWASFGIGCAVAFAVWVVMEWWESKRWSYYVKQYYRDRD